jgi:hypothetical protein
MGSRTLIHAALSGTKEEVHGKFLNSCRVEDLRERLCYFIGGEEGAGSVVGESGSALRL